MKVLLLLLLHILQLGLWAGRSPMIQLENQSLCSARFPEDRSVDEVLKAIYRRGASAAADLGDGLEFSG